MKWEKMPEDEIDFLLMDREIIQEIKTGLKIIEDLIKR